MKKIAIIGCSKTKLTGSHKAKDMYTSPRFKKSYEYAASIADEIFILSAKYGLIHENEIIDSYDAYLKDLNLPEKLKLQKLVEQQITELSVKYEFNPQSDIFLIVAGQDYVNLVNTKLRHIEAPIAGFPMGKSLQQLNHLINSKHNQLSDQIHELFNGVAQYKKYDVNNFNELGFKNGIYIFFEKGQQLPNGNPRIVRVGTHTGDDNLITRLRCHYKGSKESSIFRKNLGLCMLKQAGDLDYMDIWGATTSTKEGREKFQDKINKPKEAALEEQITKYFADNFYFVTFEVPHKEDRLRIESGLISALDYANNNKQSADWLGNFSNKTPIITSGLWLVQGLGKESIETKDLQFIKNHYNDLNLPQQNWSAIDTKPLLVKEPTRLANLTNNTNILFITETWANVS